MQTKDNLGSNDSLRHELGGGGFLAAKDHVQTENACRDFLLAAIVRRLRRVKMWSQKSYIDHYWLVVWNMNFIFPIILGISSSQLTKSYFSEVGQPPTRHDVHIFLAYQTY